MVPGHSLRPCRRTTSSLRVGGFGETTNSLRIGGLGLVEGGEEGEVAGGDLFAAELEGGSQQSALDAEVFV
jgi:hypothetical protein